MGVHWAMALGVGEKDVKRAKVRSRRGREIYISGERKGKAFVVVGDCAVMARQEGRSEQAEEEGALQMEGAMLA